MRLLRQLSFVIAGGLLLSAGLLAQDDDKDKDKSSSRDRVKTETMTGCLTKDATGSFILTDSSGTKTTVAGSGLEKHSANHTVTLTGSAKTDGGKSVFEVTKVQHVSESCNAPAK